MDPRPKAVVLLSGGVDSAVAAALYRDAFELIALTVEYGQPTAEKLAALAIADWLEVTRKPLCRIPSFSATTEPSHYFPMRNLIFLAYAAQEAERCAAKFLIVGCNADDHHDYWDCRSEFLSTMDEVLKPVGITILAPLIFESKAGVVRIGLTLGVPFDKTMSCYRPRERTPCGECNACKLRAGAFVANRLDPTPKRLDVDFGEARP